MNPSLSESLSFRLRCMKDLYAEFFLLLAQSLQEDPLVGEIDGLDRAIDQLMATIDQEMKDFRRDSEEAHRRQALDGALDGAIREFAERLRLGLELMSEQIRRRAGELAGERERLKDRLKTIKHQRRGARGYRHHVPGSVIVESQV